MACGGIAFVEMISIQGRFHIIVLSVLYGQRYRIIYQVKESEIEVVIVAVGIRRDGDKKNDIYELMKKYIKIGLLPQSQ